MPEIIEIQGEDNVGLSRHVINDNFKNLRDKIQLGDSHFEVTPDGLNLIFINKNGDRAQITNFQ